MKKVIITGAGGFIGRNLTEKLLQENIVVYGIDISDKFISNFRDCENFHPIIIEDINNLNQLDMLKNDGIDTFFHLGWGGSLLSCDLNNIPLQISNIQMSILYLEKMKELGIQNVVFGSSSYQYMINTSNHIVTSYYGIAKKATEDMFLSFCQANNIKCNIAILTNTFGVGDFSSKAVNTILKKMIENKEISLVKGDYLNDWVYIDDTVNGLITIAARGKNLKRYYIGNLNITTFKDKINIMARKTSYKKPLKFGEYLENTRVDYTCLDSNILFEDTGFYCQNNFEDSISKTILWLQERGF